MTKASEGYLKWVKSQVGEDNFSRITSSEGASTLMFVMDTTGSMSDEINAAKGIAKSIIDMTREFPVDYILSPFNDPGKYCKNFLHSIVEINHSNDYLRIGRMFAL